MIYTKNNYLQYFDDSQFSAIYGKLTLEDIETINANEEQRLTDEQENRKRKAMQEQTDFILKKLLK